MFLSRTHPPSIDSSTHQTPVGEKSRATSNSWLDHLQFDIRWHLDKVPIKVDGVEELHKRNHVPRSHEYPGLVKLYVGHGCWILSWSTGRVLVHTRPVSPLFTKLICSQFVSIFGATKVEWMQKQILELSRVTRQVCRMEYFIIDVIRWMVWSVTAARAKLSWPILRLNRNTTL